MSTYDFKGKIAIVTGAGSGINHALTELLLEAGCSVVVADVRLRPQAQQTLDKYPHPGKGTSDYCRPSAIFQPTDMSNWAQIRLLWETALQTYGRVNIVVNGAGLYEPPSSSFWNPPGGESEGGVSSSGVEPADDPDAAVGQYQTFAVNTAGPIRLAQIAVQYWLQHPELEGNVLFFASLAAYLHGMLTPLYFASKAAIVSFSKSLGGLRKHCGIRNACICPSTVHTPMIHEEQEHVVVHPDDIGLTPRECAEVALRLLREPQYGDGNIVECMKVVSDEESGQLVVRTREVPMEALYPSFTGTGLETILDSREASLLQRLQHYGTRNSVE
ncbi:short chain dehydrogenase reductase [Apiospora kogelbergensis]|uniref:Short chain dehydrogenase reductase n=1 Tax=Apiospora kogelbergensis TaxID=1337665 RepID=A0AAW0QDU1_9PEZI